MVDLSATYSGKEIVDRADKSNAEEMFAMIGKCMILGNLLDGTEHYIILESRAFSHICQSDII